MMAAPMHLFAPILAATARRATNAIDNTATFNLTVDLSLVLILACLVLSIVRILRGPHLADRALAVDVLAIMFIGLVILLSIRFRVPMFIDGVLVLSLLSFAGTVAMAQYIARPHFRKQDKPKAPQTPDAP